MSNKSSRGFNFQHYVDAVKQNEMSWNIFQDLVQEISHSDIDRLKILNAILLTELTINDSVLERLKYLNIILLTEFKNHIQRVDGFEIEYTAEDGQNSSIGHDMNDTLIRKMSTDSESQISQVKKVRMNSH